MLIEKFDNTILLFIKNNMHFYVLDKLMIFFTILGNDGRLWIVIGLVLLVTKKYRKQGLLLLLSIGIGAILGEGIIKHLVCRNRPFTHYPGIKLLISKPKGYSFPSGHTTAAFTSAYVLSKSFRKYTAVFFSIAIAIAFSRLYLYVHYPTDVIGGIVLGIISAKIGIYVFNKINIKKLRSEVKDFYHS